VLPLAVKCRIRGVLLLLCWWWHFIDILSLIFRLPKHQMRILAQETAQKMAQEMAQEY
jgi:hypothetical protein